MIVYKITNTINEKLYFGITKCSLQKRWNEHACKSKKSNLHLYVAIRKYGIENFKIEIIKYCLSEDELYNTEINLISKYKTNNPKYGYNNSTGGEKSAVGRTLSIKQKKVISNFQKNRIRDKYSIETIQKMSKSAKGRDMSEVIKKSVLARKGMPAKNRIQISKHDLNGVFIDSYNSFSEAAKSVNGVVSAFTAIKKGRLKTYKKYIWKVMS